MAAGISHALISINNETPTVVTLTNEPFNLRSNVSIQNLGTDTVYFGGENVSITSYGAAVAAGGTLSVDDLPTRFDLFAVSAEASCDVAVLIVAYA